jgi:mono/diheme cytochrome c family protein
MKRILFFLIFLLIALSACGGESVYFPQGDAQAGKQVFTELKCYSCHEVVGEDYPDPSAITPTFVALGATGESKPRPYLVESIIAPSHQFAMPRPPGGQTASDQNIKSGKNSRMANYSDQLTVRELYDLVAYLELIQGGSGAQVGSF